MSPLPLETGSARDVKKTPPSQLLAATVMEDPLYTVMKMQYICGDDPAEASKMRDVMKVLMEQLASDSNTDFNSEVKAALKADLEKALNLQLADKNAAWYVDSEVEKLY